MFLWFRLYTEFHAIKALFIEHYGRLSQLSCAKISKQLREQGRINSLNILYHKDREVYEITAKEHQNLRR